MSQSLESIYHDIGQALLEGLPDRWDVAWVVHEIDAAGVVEQCRGFCQRERDGETQEIPLGPGALPSFHHLREILRAAGKPLYRLARFTVAPGGAFELGFQYDEAAGAAPSEGGSRSGY